MGISFGLLSQSTESQSYGDYTPQEPFQVKVRWDRDRLGDRPLLYVHGFDRDTGEIDYDTNATAFVSLDQIFANEVDASLAYNRQVQTEVQNLLASAADLIRGMIVIGPDGQIQRKD